MTETQERTARGTVMLTRDEKVDVRLVAAVDETTESDLLRQYTPEQISERAGQIRANRALLAGLPADAA